MAAQREPRRTAGNRMAKVMENQLEEDEFYNTTYGGFGEEVEDNDYKSNEEHSEDEVDSDFDISENDELLSDDEDGKPKRKKRVGVMTKAYKEPIKTANADQPKKDDNKRPKTEISVVTKPMDNTLMRKSSRRATAQNSTLINEKLKKRQEEDSKKKEIVKKPSGGVRRLTQEELMAEAERTERKNLKSLMNYQRMEENRKKSSVKKRVLDGPTIKSISTTVPMVDDEHPWNVQNFQKPKVMSRNFVVFSDHNCFDEIFKLSRSKPSAKMICPITQREAKYIDPLTKIPYHDLESFKLIREAYALTPATKKK